MKGYRYAWLPHGSPPRVPGQGPISSFPPRISSGSSAGLLSTRNSQGAGQFHALKIFVNPFLSSFECHQHHSGDLKVGFVCVCVSF